MFKKVSALLASILFVSVASASEFTVMFNPGGVSDILTRYTAKEMNNEYTVVNRPGAGGRVAIRHMLQEGTPALATMAQVYVTNTIKYEKLEYDPIKDFETIGVVGVMPNALVCRKDLPIDTLEEFVNYETPLAFGIGGYGSGEHMATEALLIRAKVRHILAPFAKGGSTAVVALAGGHVDCMFGNYPTVRAWVDDPKVKVIFTSHDVGLGVPTWNSVFGEDFPFQNMISVILPRDMNQTTREQIKKDVADAFAKDGFTTGLAELGMFPIAKTDKDSINKALANNNVTREFILGNNVKLTN